MTADRIPTTFVASNGNWYTPGTVHRKVAEGEWRLCLHEVETGRRLYETAAEELVLVSPHRDDDPSEVPENSIDLRNGIELEDPNETEERVELEDPNETGELGEVGNPSEIEDRGEVEGGR